MPRPRDDLRELREQTGLPLREVAALLGVDNSTVYTWESGSRRVSGQYEAELVALYRGILETGEAPAVIHTNRERRKRRAQTFRAAGLPVPTHKTLQRAMRALSYISQTRQETGRYPTLTAIGRACQSSAGGACMTGRRMVRILTLMGELRSDNGNEGNYVLAEQVA